MSAETDGSLARISALHSLANVLGAIFPPLLFSVHLYLISLVIELDFIVKGNGFYKVEIFLNLINYLFPLSLFQMASSLQDCEQLCLATLRKLSWLPSLAISDPNAYFSVTLPYCYVEVQPDTTESCQACKITSFRTLIQNILP